MDIWLINHYAVPPQYYPLARQTYFAKYLMEMGHTVTIFAASTVHNSNKNLITDGSAWREETVNGVHYVYIKCLDYQGNGLKRVYNICEFAWKLPSVCKNFPKPDAIVSTSMPPTSCAMGVRLGRKYGCRNVAEIADLWPESIVAYGIAGPRNPAVIALRWLEKWIYKTADAVVFTMEGAYDYIVKQGWEKQIPREKVFHINNGVNLEQFHEDLKNHRLEDPDLDNPDTFKVLYTGSVRLVNGLSDLLDCAIKMQKYKDIQFLVYGGGDDLASLQEIVREKQLTNIHFKGRVDKKYVPYILSRGNLNILSGNLNKATELFQYGVSPNKLFEYMASGKPIVSNFDMNYDLIKKYNCGFSQRLSNADEYAEVILKLYRMPKEEYLELCKNSEAAAKDYDFRVHTKRLISILENKAN